MTVITVDESKKNLEKVIEQVITRSPFDGIGKPEPLKGDLSGKWSRRINHEHRLVMKSGPTPSS